MSQPYPPPQPWQPGQPGQPGGAVSPSDRAWGGAAHWTALVAAFLALAFLGPLIVMLVRADAPWVRRQAVESLNFQLSVLIYGLVGGVVAIVVIVLTLGIGVLVVIPLAMAFGLLWLVFTIIGAVKASNGEDYRYPLTIRMVS